MRVTPTVKTTTKPYVLYELSRSYGSRMLIIAEEKQSKDKNIWCIRSEMVFAKEISSSQGGKSTGGKRTGIGEGDGASTSEVGIGNVISLASNGV